MWTYEIPEFEVIPLGFVSIVSNIIETQILLPDHLSYFQVIDSVYEDIETWVHEFTEDSLQGVIVNIMELTKPKEDFTLIVKYHKLRRKIQHISHEMQNHHLR